jgi:multiple sugar transport system ATP-binding protein
VVQQLAEPKDIYNDPANLFVAGFIGSPTMNLIQGDLSEGNFSSNNVLIEKIGGGSRRSVVLGVRPEDTEIVKGDRGHFSAPIYSVELTGEVTLVNVSLDGDNIFSIRADKDFVGEINKNVNVRINLNKFFLFDSTTEQRIRV